MSDQATEVQPLDQYECRACGYVYEPTKGTSMGKVAVSAGTPFEEIPAGWRCPVCGAQEVSFPTLDRKKGLLALKKI